jgi:hypothetical protein
MPGPIRRHHRHRSHRVRILMTSVVLDCGEWRRRVNRRFFIIYNYNIKL